MPPLDISVVILTMNRPARCLETVRRAALAAKGLAAEILVVNNGREPVPLPDRTEGVPGRVLTMPRNLGAAARNEGWREARGRAVLMLDDDAAIAPGLPEALVQGLDAEPGTGALFFRVHDGQKEEGCLLPTVFHGCACGFRRDTLERTGGYPHSFVYYGEEYDLTFRLYRAGLPPRLCEQAPAVHHARDPGGRDTARIIRFLVRNNAETWFAHFPLGEAVKALADTLRWYRRVGLKEHAQAGFRKGCAETPAAMLRGLARRRPLGEGPFRAATLAGPVAQVARDIRARGFTRVAICGVGKLPSLWLGILRRAGLTPIAFLDHNPAWLGQTIQGIPIHIKSDATWPLRDSSCVWLTGTSSRPDNLQWGSELREQGFSAQTLAVPTHAM
jgi:GT2 family glycosyltransferase